MASERLSQSQPVDCSHPARSWHHSVGIIESLVGDRGHTNLFQSSSQVSSVMEASQAWSASPVRDEAVNNYEATCFGVEAVVKEFGAHRRHSWRDVPFGIARVRVHTVCHPTPPTTQSRSSARSTTCRSRAPVHRLLRTQCVSSCRSIRPSLVCALEWPRDGERVHALLPRGRDDAPPCLRARAGAQLLARGAAPPWPRGHHVACACALANGDCGAAWDMLTNVDERVRDDREFVAPRDFSDPEKHNAVRYYTFGALLGRCCCEVCFDMHAFNACGSTSNSARGSRSALAWRCGKSSPHSSR